jgi:hypothetical protein
LVRDGISHGTQEIEHRLKPMPSWESAMLDPPKLRRLDQPIAVSLEDLVPPDHFYRHLEEKLDLDFVRG